MVYTAAYGSKVPLSVIEKSKKTYLFQIREVSSGLCRSKKGLVYTENYSLVDKDSFGAHHLKTHGNVYALLILDNCSAHKYLDDINVARKFGLLDKLCIFFNLLTSHLVFNLQIWVS